MVPSQNQEFQNIVLLEEPQVLPHRISRALQSKPKQKQNPTSKFIYKSKQNDSKKKIKRKDLLPETNWDFLGFAGLQEPQQSLHSYTLPCYWHKPEKDGG